MAVMSSLFLMLELRLHEIIKSFLKKDCVLAILHDRFGHRFWIIHALGGFVSFCHQVEC